MGSIHEASCACGYTTNVTIGGGRYNFHEKSLFPFYCMHCGLVHVNTALLNKQSTVTECPKCGDPNATQYGVAPVSRQTALNTQRTTSFALEWGSRKAAKAGNLCPACRKMTLKFSDTPDLLFD